MPPFVHLTRAERYLPGLWDFTRDATARARWADRLGTHLDDTIRHAREREGADVVEHLESIAPAWREVIARLGDLGAPPPARTVLELVTDRDARFRGDGPGGEAGPMDVFGAIKRGGDTWALERYGSAVSTLERETDPERRFEQALAGVIAGNVFDVAAASVAEAARAGGSALEALAEEVRSKPLAIDHRHAFLSLAGALLGDLERPGVLLFVDNAGMDFVLGVLPFARELARAGFVVTLAANERPALNDVTASEAGRLVAAAARGDRTLADLLSARRVSVVSTGNGTPGIDLREVAAAVNTAPSDLIIFEGQGRAVESTWLAELARPSMRVATLKSPLVAERLGLEAFDTIVEVREAGAPPVRSISIEGAAH